MEESFSRRPLTPGEAREARKQQAMREHQEKIKLLNKERQSILTNEVLWTGRAESMQQRQQGNAAAEERARQRMALVQQLQQERAASETMLEALRAVSASTSLYFPHANELDHTSLPHSSLFVLRTNLSARLRGWLAQWPAI